MAMIKTWSYLLLITDSINKKREWLKLPYLKS